MDTRAVRERQFSVNVIAVVMLGIATVVAAAPSGTPKLRPAAEKSPAPLSRYQRERLEKYNNSAPADRYFGRMKISYLGMNNTFRDAAIMSGDHTVDSSIAGKVEFADDALQDWSRRYPRDPQLARTYYLAIRADQKLWLKHNQERAWTYMNRIASTFPTSYFGRVIKKDIAIGFTEHYYADAVPCPTPTPSPEPTVAVTPSPAVTEPPRGKSRSKATPEPTATPTPEPTPTPVPTAPPRPAPQTIGKGLKVQIETQACVAPPTPTPSPSPTALPTAPPAPSPAALPPGSPAALPLGSPAASPALPIVSASPSPRP
jgi:hypothetical protein